MQEEDQLCLLESLLAESEDAAFFNENLARLKYGKMSASEQVTATRRLTGRISSKLTQDKDSGLRVDIFLTIAADINHVRNLLEICEATDDAKTVVHIFTILRDSVAAKTLWRARNLAHLITWQATGVVAGTLAKYVETMPDNGVISAFWILSALATKDEKFSLRFAVALNYITPLLNRLACRAVGLYPVLQVVKALARNAGVAQTLGEQGLVQSLVKIYREIMSKKKFCPKLKASLEALFMIGKYRTNTYLLLEEQICPDLLDTLQAYQCHLTQKRQCFKITGSVLNILLQIVATDQGRTHFQDSNGVDILKTFSLELKLSHRFGDRLLVRTWNILSKCCRANLLPISDDCSPLQFDVPNINWRKRTNGNYSSNTSRETTPESEEDEIADDEDEDDEDAFAESISDEGLRSAKISPKVGKVQKRTDQDLRNSYQQFFLEFNHVLGGHRDVPGNDFENAKVSGLQKFVHVPLPDRTFLEHSSPVQNLHGKAGIVFRAKVSEIIRNTLDEKHYPRVLPQGPVIYDLDQLLDNPSSSMDDPSSSATDPRPALGQLEFESRFEGGNLRKVLQVGEREYDLILTPDVNTRKHHQWFYFSVTNMMTSTVYTFNIINYEKANSQFNFGMQPLMFSEQEFLQKNTGWSRVGSDVIYFKNQFSRSLGQGSNYMTASFKVTFPHSSQDVCYLAYHFPYTYSRLLKHLCQINHSKSPDTYIRMDVLTHSLAHHEVPMVTITSQNDNAPPIKDRKLVVLTSRVHPGESNASYIMEGLLNFLVSDDQEAGQLRAQFIFKIIPMLNVDGVINGCHRCNLIGEDLNRCWDHPHSILHPSIFHAKGILAYCCQVLQTDPFLFCDFHGHSRKKGIFLYGCSPQESWLPSDMNKLDEHSIDPKALADVLHDNFPGFEQKSCRYSVEKSRESTARIVIWREFKVPRSYTLESTFCGFNKRQFKGQQITTEQLSETGKQFGRAILKIDTQTGNDAAPSDEWSESADKDGAPQRLRRLIVTLPR